MAMKTTTTTTMMMKMMMVKKTTGFSLQQIKIEICFQKPLQAIRSNSDPRQETISAELGSP
jgi:hypothetical protein